MKKIALIDFNNFAYLTIFNNYVIKDNILLEEDFNIYRNFLKTMMLKIQKIKADEIIVAKDGYSWRKKIYKNYKAQRKIIRDKQKKINYKIIFKYFDDCFNDLKKLFPYKFIQGKNAEVDDIIAIIVKEKYNDFDEFIIYSTDKDFIQLLEYKKVKIINPKKHTIVKSNNPKFDLFLKIFRGDKSDNIPSIKPRVRTDKIKRFYIDSVMFDLFLKENELEKAYERNKKLIDFKEIPEYIKKEVLELYNKNEDILDNLSKAYKILNKYYIKEFYNPNF